MNSAAWGASFSGPGLHCHSQSVRARRSRVYCQRVQAVLAPVEPSSRSVILHKQSLGGDDSLLQRGGPLQGVARSGRALAGQLLGLLSLNGVLANPEQSFRDVERLRELGGQATERGLQVGPFLHSCITQILRDPQEGLACVKAARAALLHLTESS